MSTTTYDFGDVVLIQFPFTNLVGSKKRPAIVVSSNSYNISQPDIVLMAVTSQLHATVSIGEFWITDWQAAGLIKPSAAKPVFFTFEQSLVLKTLGKLQSSDLSAIRNNIHSIPG